MGTNVALSASCSELVSTVSLPLAPPFSAVSPRATLQSSEKNNSKNKDKNIECGGYGGGFEWIRQFMSPSHDSSSAHHISTAVAPAQQSPSHQRQQRERMFDVAPEIEKRHLLLEGVDFHCDSKLIDYITSQVTVSSSSSGSAKVRQCRGQGVPLVGRSDSKGRDVDTQRSIKKNHLVFSIRSESSKDFD